MGYYYEWRGSLLLTRRLSNREVAFLGKHDASSCVWYDTSDGQPRLIPWDQDNSQCAEDFGDAVWRYLLSLAEDGGEPVFASGQMYCTAQCDYADTAVLSFRGKDGWRFAEGEVVYPDPWEGDDHVEA